MIAALVRGNLSALRCDRNALYLLAAGTLVIALAATLGAVGSFQLFFFVGYVLVPIFCAAIGAVQISGERASGYASVVHTAPVTASAYFVAKWITAFLWTSLALLLTVPFGLLFALFLGPAFLAEYLPWIPAGLLLGAFGSGLGLLLSVLVGRRGLLPSAFGGIGLALALTLVPLLLQALPDAMKEAATPLLRLSPIINALASGDAGVSLRPLEGAEGWRSWGALAYYSVLYAALGYVLYTRFQNAEAWDAPRKPLAATLVVAMLLVVVPAYALGGDPLGLEQQRARREEVFARAPPSVGISAAVSEPGQSVDPDRGGFGPQMVLRPGEPRPFQLTAMAHGDESITGAVLRLRPAQGHRLLIEPQEFPIGSWPSEPCPNAPPQAGCRRFLPQAFQGTVTVTLPTSLQEGDTFLFSLEFDTDQGNVRTAPNQNWWIDPPDYPWWAAFVVWFLVVLAFGIPQTERRRRLGRKPAVPAAPKPAVVVRRG